MLLYRNVLNRNTRNSLLNKLRRLYIKDNTGLTDQNIDDILPVLEDYLLPTIVRSFYEEQSKSFIDYLDSISIENIESKAPSVSAMIRRLINVYLEEISQYSNQDSISLLGDLHEKGYTKIRVNDTIIYKNEPRYDRFIDSFLQILPSTFSHFFPKFQEKDGSVIREFVKVNLNADNNEQIQEYYFNLGLIIPVLLVLRTIDVYAENILISLPNPILFDMECMFSGYQKKKDSYSLSHTGIIKSSDEYDISAITGGSKPIPSYLKPILTGTDSKPKVIWKVPSKGHFSNIPRLNNKPVDPVSYKQEILEGMKSSLAIVNKRLDQISELLHEEPPQTRVVVRPTKNYKILLHKYCFPNIYQEQKDPHNFFTKELRKLDTVYKIGNKDMLIESEVSTLCKGILPKFYSQINEMGINGPNEKDPIAHFEKTQMEVWNSYIKRFESFGKEQLKILDATLKT